MDPRTVLIQVESWPPEDRLRLMERIRDGLLGEGHDPALTEEQKAEIDRRLADDDAAPDDVVTREEIKAEALRRAGRSCSRVVSRWSSVSSSTSVPR